MKNISLNVLLIERIKRENNKCRTNKPITYESDELQRHLVVI